MYAFYLQSMKPRKVEEDIKRKEESDKTYHVVLRNRTRPTILTMKSSCKKKCRLDIVFHVAQEKKERTNAKGLAIASMNKRVH